MYNIRPIEPRDYAAGVAIRNSAYPEPVPVEVFAEWCELDPKRNTHYHHLVAEDGAGQVVGTVIVCQNEWLAANEWWMQVIVHPDSRGRGAGSTLYEAAERIARERGATAIHSHARGEDEAARPWAEHRGFECTRERTESVMSLAEWDASLFADAVTRAEASGLRFLSLPDVEGEMLRRLYDFESATLPDWPGFTPPFPTYQTWARLKEGEQRDRTPKIWVLALDGEQIVGCCVIDLPRGEEAGARIGFTGVRREYRGRGLALALKVLATEQTSQAGVSHIRTNNDNDNPAILALNARLGYRLVPGPLQLKKAL